MAQHPPVSHRRLPWIIEGIRVQASVTGALLMRELHTRYGRRGLGYVWLFLEPLFLAVAVILIKTVVRHGREFPGIDPVPFTIVGYVNFMMFRSIFNRADGALEANASLLYHRMVTVWDLCFSRALLEALATAATFIIILTFAILLGHADVPARPFNLIAGFGMLWLWSFPLSLLICAWSYENATVSKFVHPISYILLPLSGAFYMVQWVPAAWRDELAYWPMAMAFEEMRYGMFDIATDQYVDMPYFMIVCMILLLLGLLSLRELRHRLTLS
jgi:capsular polysaccharide transport system permease protein